VGDLGEIVRRARGQVSVDELLRGAPTEQHGHFVLELMAGHQESILGRTLNGVAQGTDTSRNDRYFVYGIAAWQRHGDQCMAHFVMSNDLAFLRVEDAALFLESRDDALDRLREI